MSTFDDLGLSPELLSTLGEMGFASPTAIQEAAITSLLEVPRDFVGLAHTGTGKTAAFGLPLLERTDPDEAATQALILAPTRELSQQIHEQLRLFSAKLPKVGVQVVYGGAPIMGQIKALRRCPQILVATPGRLIDLAKRKAVDLSKVRFLVLDEADEMLNMGFREELVRILELTPPEKNTWLFSATMPPDIRTLSNRYMTDPVEVQVGEESRINLDIEHRFAVVKASDRMEALKRFMDNHAELYGIAFCRTRAETRKTASRLAELGYPVDAIHGELSQQQRDLVMQKFKAGHVLMLVATDVAARGIDVDDLTHVIHMGLPDDVESYTHRSGRTARAGKRGISLAIITRNEMRKIKQIEHRLRIRLHKIDVPRPSEVLVNHVRHWARQLTRTEVSEALTDELLELAEEEITALDRRGLLRHLLSLELHRLGYDDDSRDLNHQAYREEEPHQPSRGTRMLRFFINVGHIDDLGKGDLLRFVCEHTGLDRENIGSIRLYDKHSTFEVDEDHANVVVPAFADVEVRGRPLRVNRDNDRYSSDRPKHKGRGGYKKGGYNKGRGGGGYNKRGGHKGGGGYKGGGGGYNKRDDGGGYKGGGGGGYNKRDDGGGHKGGGGGGYNKRDDGGGHKGGGGGGYNKRDDGGGYKAGGYKSRQSRSRDDRPRKGSVRGPGRRRD